MTGATDHPPSPHGSITALYVGMGTGRHRRAD